MTLARTIFLSSTSSQLLGVRNFHKFEGQVYTLYFSHQEYWKFNIFLLLSVNFSTKPNFFLVLVEYKVTQILNLVRIGWIGRRSVMSSFCSAVLTGEESEFQASGAKAATRSDPSINNVSLRKIISSHHIVILTNV